jgi:SAM-dependent methyltransferase
LLGWEQAFVDEQVADLFGYHALQIGPAELDALRTNRMPHRWRASLAAEKNMGQVMLDAEDLPFPAESLDLVVLSHVLEFSADPHQLIREVERVLIPEGRILVTGFNPYSLWGVRQHMLRGMRKPYLPEEGEFLGLSRLRDWMKLLAFETEHSKSGCYIPPIWQEKWIERWRWIDAIGDRWWPFAGAVYAIKAVKRVRGLRLIGPSWKSPKPGPAAAVPAANSNASCITVTVKKATHEG